MLGQDEAAPEERLAQVNSAIDSIQQWLDSASNNRSEQEQSLRRVSQQIDSLNNTIENNQRSIAELSAHLEDLAKRLANLTEEKTKLEHQVSTALRASYMSGPQNQIKVLLNQEDPAKSARMLQYLAYFNKQRSEQIQQFRRTITQIDTLRQETEDSSAQLLSTQAELAQQQQNLEAEQDERNALLQALKQEIASRSGELEQLQQDRQTLEELIDKINDAIANIPPPEQLTPFAAARGTMPLPLQGQIGSRFGASYSDGNLHRQGVILLANEGDPVRAIHPGRIVFSDWLRGSGLLVVVDHGEGYLSLYAQNQSLVKRKGDWVNRGEPLATAGGNAGTGQAGIYFEIRHNGTAQDPLLWCDNL